MYLVYSRLHSGRPLHRADTDNFRSRDHMCRHFDSRRRPRTKHRMYPVDNIWEISVQMRAFKWQIDRSIQHFTTKVRLESAEVRYLTDDAQRTVYKRRLHYADTWRMCLKYLPVTKTV